MTFERLQFLSDTIRTARVITLPELLAATREAATQVDIVLSSFARARLVRVDGDRIEWTGPLPFDPLARDWRR